MVDQLSVVERSRLMGRVRHRGTCLEIALRKALWKKGLRYRLKSKQKLPGTPDILFPALRIAVFVDGCFWHGCPVHGTMPKTNTSFWVSKIKKNKRRDREVDAKLKAINWRSVRFWEHDIRKDLSGCVKSIARMFRRQ